MMPITQGEQEAWNEEIRKQNAALLTEAAKSHAIKQEVIKRLQDAARYVTDQYPLAGDGTRPMPESTSELFEQLQRMWRSLKQEKEQVPLLGQAVEELKVELPAWAELKEP
jgi:hypothetical protein